MPADALLDLTPAEIDAVAEVGDLWRQAILDSGEAATHAANLAACGCTKIDFGEGLVFVGPHAADDDARALLAAREDGEQRRREEQRGYAERQREAATALDRSNFERWKHRGNAPAVLALHLRLRSRAVAVLQRLRPRSREHRARRRRRATARSAARRGDPDPDGETDPPRGRQP